MKRKILKAFHDYNSVLGECAHINTRRIYYLSIIAIPLRIINIFLFTFTKSNDTQVLKTWSQGIIASHFILLILMIVFFLTTHRLKNRIEPNTTMFVLQYIVVVVIMASGIAIVTFDQLVTTNITPFLLICIINGVIFIIRPLASFIIYATSYVTYYYLIALTITDQQVLLSNRVNGITAIGIGFLLSFILWHYNYTNIIQKRRIEIQQKQLEKMAYYDPLTDLPNRRLLEKLIKREFSSMKRYGHETVIIILDIDDFKKINDTYGHPVGDNILMQLADLLKSNVRESDTVSRFGGEEFIILMPRTSLEEGYVFAERLRKLIMEKRFTIGTVTLGITSSFGVSSMRDISPQALEDCYFLADKALYLAKQSGKNRVKKASESAGMTDSCKDL
ncbi:MAG TPA: GGDEF domain-containing protein [Bacillota bacterium]|nr:GGDEF domain-containing protein [Bacillota bacterium]HQI15804.1 GGDEF domain-containing protein [Bacillota bacterium]HQJ37449.1 GGDEF domain-containing protein [Bacillota bacterium]HQL37142.1 GGDEF domain-containing protein [Bacillota bacterium]